ncbi:MULTISPECIES: FtsK/SpoIIIE domain-containing protein [unclassified Brevibacterium]|uniref:FtsK/SpoIIIE domain-containing protein n=1 Tax=unclassified Brevibacterium TaxID=2614124 RepID=UPI001E639377|nr:MULTISPECIES: FtsK/SpoIIIE domain-containing protein [unclassified Brevibacterium]MDK8434744.1 FtsK/SpoIIIE domain-containing protein [Brevibacterium sp. H-BE7]
MKTLGLVHRIDANANIRSAVLEADSEQRVLDVLRAVFGPVLTASDLLDGNRFPADGPSPETIALTISWGRWHSLNPVTTVGARFLHRGRSTASVSVLAGPDAGFALNVDPRSTSLSRVAHPSSLTILDPCIPRRPSRLELDPSHGSAFARMGATILAPASDATAPLRTPRTAASVIRAPPHRPTDADHVAPDAVDDPHPARPPQWWTFLIPIGIGIALAVLTGMWWFLLFSASAPLSGYVAYAMEKKRFARESHQCELDRAAALERGRERLTAAIADHTRTVRSGPGLCLGFGSVLSDITIAEELRPYADHRDGTVILDQVPIRIDPLTTSVAVTGESEQLRHMALAWLSDPGVDWDPSAALLALPELQGTRFVSSAAEDSAPALLGSAAEQRVRLRLCDGEGREADLSARPDDRVSLQLEAPAAASAISVRLGGLAQARTTASSAPNGPVPGEALVATLMPPGRFITLEHGHASRTEERWPSHGLGDLCEHSPEAIAARWRQTHTGPVMIGRGETGTVGIDLFGDGPHALVAGTTGSGKSLLLQTWLLAMALAHPPRRLRFVLIDFKGGATFSPLEDLPHTDSVLDDFDSAAAFRALVSVRAEITRRERLLADHGCSDVLELLDPPPRLVVVIDEFHALMATHPKAAELLEHLTALGRSLGVHLILATQRPLGVVTGHMKANINIRVCLRVRDDTDSYDVIGVAAAAHLPSDTPGAACLDSGSEVCRFRVAVPIADASAAEVVHRPRLRPWVPGQGLLAGSGVNGIRSEDIITAARAESMTSPARTVVLPSLPRLADLERGLRTEDDPDIRTTATGIIDIPSHQRQSVWTYTPEIDGSTIVIGPATEHVSSVLVRLAEAAARTHRIVALGRIASALEWAEVRSGMETGWRLQTVLDHLGRTRVPTVVVCGNWGEFVDSLDHHWADQAERLLKHSSSLGLTFLVAGCRTSAATSAGFSTQLIFPPSAGGDGLSVGLSRQRFVGDWPDWRAVIVGPSSSLAGRDGADVQLLPAEFGETGGPAHVLNQRRGFEPRWRGFDRPPERVDQSVPRGTGIPLGLDAFGEIVCWDPVREGPVLTVRGSPQSGKSTLTRRLEDAGLPVLVHDDAHLESSPEEFDLLDGGAHVVTMPVRFTPGYASSLAKAQNMGPLLLLGSHSRQDLTALGILRLAPLEGQPGLGWLVMEQRARVVRLFPTDTEAVLPGGRRGEAAPPLSSRS